MKKSKLKTGDKVKIIRLPVLQSKYGCCIGFNQGVGKVDVVESNDGTHVFLKDCGGCYQPDQLKRFSSPPKRK